MAEEFVLAQVASEIQRAVNNALNPDTSLAVSGKPADAKAVGDALANCPKPTDAQVATSVRAWLDEHPEATTTVEDGSITYEKLHPDTVSQLSEDIGAVGKPTDEQVQTAVDNYLDENGVVLPTTLEPAEDDIPKVFFSGDNSGMSKDDEKVLQFAYKSRSANFGGYVKMKWQGSSTLAFPKKNFTIKMFEDETCETKLKKAFKHWGHEKNKYVLKADYIDHTHARNIITANLWTEMVASRPDFDSLPDGMKNAPGHGAIDGFPIKLYMNGVYQGIYTWTIGKEDWMFGMDEDNANHAVLCAEKNNNGNAATTDNNILSCEFRANANIDGNDWDLEFPDALTANIKTSFNNLINCVKNTDDATFKATIGNYLDLTSALDYYILAYLSANVDGLGKNLIMMTYDGVKWFCSAYDMDNIWGSRGTNTFVDADYACPDEYYDTNSLLWQRMESCFGAELYARYQEVRKTVLSFENVITKFERFCDLIGTELYAEDVEIYSGIPYPTQNNLKQIRNFFTPRAEYVDACFAEIGGGESGGDSGDDSGDDTTTEVSCTGITLSDSSLTFTTEGTKALTATVTPNGCTDAVAWESTNTGVATVKNGIVTAVGNGDAVITAICGKYSATCTVSVAIELPEPSYIYQMAEATNFGTAADVVNTGVAPLSTDSNWSIAFDMTPAAHTSEVCVFVIDSALKFLIHPSKFNNCYGFSTTNNTLWIPTNIPMGTTEKVTMVLTHASGSDIATAQYCVGGIKRSISFAVGTGSGVLYIGADDGWSTPVRPWTGTMNSFEIQDRVMTDMEINAFLGGTVMLYQMAEPTTFASASDCVNTGVPLWQIDQDFTIALDMTPKAQTAEATVFATNYSSDPYSGLTFVCINSDVYRLHVFGTVQTATSVITDIPYNHTENVKLVLTHKSGLNEYSVAYRYAGQNTKNTIISKHGNSHQNPLCIGAADGWSTPVRPWIGTMNQFEIYSNAFTDEEVDAFLNA